MAIDGRALRGFILAVVALATLILVPTASWAADDGGNQAIAQSASLVAPDPAVEIAIYPEPGTRQRQVGYGNGGDAVMVLEQVGSNQGITWHRVRFEQSPYLEGWVQDEFLLFTGQANSSPANQTQRQNQNAGNAYFGNSQIQSSRQNQFENYSQQQQH